MPIFKRTKSTKTLKTQKDKTSTTLLKFVDQREIILYLQTPDHFQ